MPRTPLAIRCGERAEAPRTGRPVRGAFPGNPPSLGPEGEHRNPDALAEGNRGTAAGREDLEGETSPWETRAAHRWQRRHVATDSSAEQGLEVGRSPGGRSPLEPGNGNHRRAPRTPAHERVETLLLRQGRPAPLEPWSLSRMWGSASADRSLFEIQGTVLAPGSHLGGIGEDGRQRQGGNDRSDAARLLTRGTLRRVTAARGTATFVPTSFERVGRAPGNATNPIAGSGVQQTRNADAEQAAEGVRNPEGGTGFDGSHRRTEGSVSFREWTHRRSDGRGVQSGRIPREEELGPLRRLRGVPAETRAL
jgi:hypothetical protein